MEPANEIESLEKLIQDLSSRLEKAEDRVKRLEEIHSRKGWFNHCRVYSAQEKF